MGEVTRPLTLGERIAWYRRRRGKSQEALAGLVGRSVDWLSKVENNRISLDRLSVIRDLARQLGVTLGALLDEPVVHEAPPHTTEARVGALRDVLMDYRQITPILSNERDGEPAPLDELQRDIARVWDAYQASRYALMIRRLPALLVEAQHAARTYEGDENLRALRLLAMTYQGVAMVLTKIGQADLAWIAAERGLGAAQDSGDPVVIGSLLRSVTHTLLSTSRYRPAVQLTQDAATFLEHELRAPSPEMLSIYGTLFLTGSMAAARSNDPTTTRAFLREADQVAHRLGTDANHVWTAFGPTNVTIHRVSTAMELGDVQIAVDLGPTVNTSALPTERRVRHALEVAHALTASNRFNQAIAELLSVERLAPEQVRHHFLSRRLVRTWMRRPGRPTDRLSELARRLSID